DGDGASAATEAPAAKPVEEKPAPIEAPAPPPTPAPPQQTAPPPPPPAQAPPPPPPVQAAPPAPPAAKTDGSAASVEELRRTKSSPLVRKIAQEHGVDISQLEGTGLSGRVTKNDILSYIESGPTSAAPERAVSSPAPAAIPVQEPV